MSEVSMRKMHGPKASGGVEEKRTGGIFVLVKGSDEDLKINRALKIAMFASCVVFLSPGIYLLSLGSKELTLFFGLLLTMFGIIGPLFTLYVYAVCKYAETEDCE